MSYLAFADEELLGVVESVDTGAVNVFIQNDDKIRDLQVNHLVAIQSSKVNQHLIGLVSRIVRKSVHDESDPDEIPNSYNIVRVALIGTHYNKDGTAENRFKRTLTVVPTINAGCFLISGDNLKLFMQAVSSVKTDGVAALQVGNYSIDDDATAWLNGNKFFQRHAVIVGSTGSGKSWCVANILEQIALLKSANAILFDIHGEYSPLIGNNFRHYKVAGPNDALDESMIFLPYWLLTYDEMLSLMLDRSDNNAPNQAMAFSSNVIDEKRKSLQSIGKDDLASVITLDSPIPYDLEVLISKLEELDTGTVPGAKQGTEKQGPLNGKLTRFVQRLKVKASDKRLNFMFSSDKKLLDYGYMETLCKKLMAPANAGAGGIKIIDFSEVPSDVLPLIVSLIARIIFSLQQWTDNNKRNPVAIFCDEAHLYMPCSTENTIDQASLTTFERISKEGRKYGLGLVVITQRPSEVNRTVLSQSNNFISMRLTNADDQAVVKRLFPDNLGDFSEILPILDIGEAIIVGDASLLPSRVRISKPNLEPRSQTVDFWDVWAKESVTTSIVESIDALRRQSK